MSALRNVRFQIWSCYTEHAPSAVNMKAKQSWPNQYLKGEIYIIKSAWIVSNDAFKNIVPRLKTHEDIIYISEQ